MKALIAIAATLFATSAFAGTNTIMCAAYKNAEIMMNIDVDSSTQQVLGAAIYNIDWSETPQNTFSATKAVGSVNPVQGIQVVLQDGKTLDIDYSIFEAGHKGSVVVDSQDEYYCFPNP